MRCFVMVVTAVCSEASAGEARQRSTLGKKNWKPIKPRKFGYDVSVRPSKRTSVRPYRLGGRGRGVSRYSSRSHMRETKECHLSLAGFFFFRKVRKTLISNCHANQRSERLI